ncbi:hypothetical protein WAI453_011475, partial [Rhynchosporium graminicola]
MWNSVIMRKLEALSKSNFPRSRKLDQHGHSADHLIIVIAAADFKSASFRADSPAGVFLEDVFNHVALPPRLPGRQDTNLPGIERDLIDRLQVASFSFVLDPGIESLRRSLHTARCVNLNGSLTKQSLLSAFRDLNYTDFILIHIGQQNAALIVRREK